MSGLFVTDGNLVHNFSRDYLEDSYDYEEIYNFTNTSFGDTGQQEKELWREIPLGIVLTLLCLLTSVGNAMVLHAVRTERRLQSVSNMFIVSLAIADLIVGLFVMPISTVYIFTDEWLFGIAVCQIWIGIDYTASTASILNLFILSLDRYWSVTSPLKYIRKRTKKRAVIMITIVWMVSSLWIIPIAGWHHFFHGGTRTVPSDTCDTEYAKNTVLKVVTAFFNFYLPLAVMYALYWKIFQEIRKRSELELGQRNVKNTKNSYNSSYIPNMNSCNEDLSYSDPNGDTGSDNNSLNNVHYVCNHSSNEVSLYDMSAMKPERIKRGYFSLRFLNRTKSERLDPKNNVSDRINYHCKRGKVEYVYDENVIDEETEKVERFYYEDTSGMPSNHKHNVLILQSNTPGDKTMSLPSTPISSSSSTEDKRLKMIEKEKYSILRGLKKIREAENIFDTSVNSQRKKANHSSRNNAFVFRDERLRRRASNKFNIKDRIKNIRQSSALTKEIKAARQLGVIMGAFTLCFLPYFILFLVVAFCDGCIDQGLLLAMTWVGYLNSTLNPFLYPLCNANFRRKFRSMLRLRRKRRRRKRNFHDQNSITTARYD